MMKCAVFSNSNGAMQGGGVINIMGIASALADLNAVDFFAPQILDQQQVKALFPHFGQLPVIRQEPQWIEAPLIGEFQRAVYDTRYDTIIVQSPYVPRFTFSNQAYVVCEFPFQRKITWKDRRRLNSYKAIIAISEFTAHWIKHRWGVEASLLYPPVVPITPKEKKPYILGVGRFVGGGRSKCQVELVQIFRRLYNQGLTNWELHLAGFVQNKQYVKEVEAVIQGLPVKLHLNISRDDLENLYSESSIFWHAVGVGVDQESEPEKMEHFGMVTIEAMSAGCVPVVINRGGQTEIIANSGAGMLWETYDECVDFTWDIAHNETKMAQYMKQAIVRADFFSHPRFFQNVQQIFKAG
jgi:glycosyltransferase involved in cell wall biosynthesis